MSYAQDGEDIIFEEFWRAEHGDQTGFYVEIGGYHPVRFSNTYRLYKKGWNGVIVEPTPGKKRLFEIIRPRDVFVPKAAGLTTAKKSLYTFSESALNKILDENEHANRRPIGAKVVIVEQVPTNKIFEETVPKGTKIDLLSIDVEGNEMPVLKSINWLITAPNFILIEDDNFKINEPKQSETYRYLTTQGYCPIARTRRNVLYKKK